SPDAGVGAVWNGAQACGAQGGAGVPCCAGDFDKVGGTQVTDIFAFLSAWFGGSPYAAISNNGVGTPRINDIFVFLSAWFGGC
ncbi:MAG: hypothetical protein K2Q20_13150, partial [Phycisphaerales bacterium]|nr:hypothetical protein [Phycisphaerales bacterium]